MLKPVPGCCEFIRQMCIGAVVLAAMVSPLRARGAHAQKKPNIILFMTDDQGWGDVGFNGNQAIVTPHLDRLCDRGARLYHFFAGGPVCSPTRATVMTGRHYYRHGIWSANTGRLPREEYTIAQGLKDIGYTCGHFGKWHLGSPHPDYKGKGGGGDPKKLARPEWYGYDKHFVTHHAVKTWDPYGPNGDKIDQSDNPYWEDGQRVTERVTGDDTAIIMDRVIPFVKRAARQDQPFLAVIWTHAPHTPLEAGPRFQAFYEARGLDRKTATYYGIISALDEQVGRLDKTLKALDLWDDTQFWFCADNGPASHVRNGGTGSTDDMRGKKSHLFNGGVCVPAFVVWPGKVPAGQTVKTPLSTLDYLPTIFSATGASLPDRRPLDGENILDIVTGVRHERSRAIPFRHGNNNAPGLSLLRNQYRYYTDFDTGSPQGDRLYNFFEDRREQVNLIDQEPHRAAAMRKEALAFLASCRWSFQGEDYAAGHNYQALGTFQKMTNRPWSPEMAIKTKRQERTSTRKNKKR